MARSRTHDKDSTEVGPVVLDGGLVVEVAPQDAPPVGPVVLTGKPKHDADPSPDPAFAPKPEEG